VLFDADVEKDVSRERKIPGQELGYELYEEEEVGV